MSIKTTEQIINSPSARAWYQDYLRSQKNTWQRGEAKQGLQAAILLAVGTNNTVELIEGRTRRDLAVSINGGEPRALSFFFE